MLRLTLMRDFEDGPVVDVVLEERLGRATIAVSVNGQTYAQGVSVELSDGLRHAIDRAIHLTLPAPGYARFGDRTSLRIELGEIHAQHAWCLGPPEGAAILESIVGELVRLGRQTTGLYAVR